MVPQYSLSEVRFLLRPGAGTTAPAGNQHHERGRTATLSWRYGRRGGIARGVPRHRSERPGPGIATVTEPTCQVAVDLGKTYYWKVAEVNAAEDPAAWESDVWKFTAQPFIAVDDFESYTNDSPTRVFQTWIDGVGFSPDEFFPNGNDGNGTGALVGIRSAVGQHHGDQEGPRRQAVGAVLLRLLRTRRPPRRHARSTSRRTGPSTASSRWPCISPA